MKIISLWDVVNLKRKIISPNKDFTSYRCLVRSDNMGFSINKTIIPKNNPVIKWHYKHHLEACYCVSGKGTLTNLMTKEKHLILPDMLYALDKNDPHTFEAVEKTVLLCVFNPALKGNEIHKEDGSYEF